MGRINIELQDELHKEAKLACVKKGITLIEFVNQAIKEKLKSQ